MKYLKAFFIVMGIIFSVLLLLIGIMFFFNHLDKIDKRKLSNGEFVQLNFEQLQVSRLTDDPECLNKITAKNLESFFNISPIHIFIPVFLDKTVELGYEDQEIAYEVSPASLNPTDLKIIRSLIQLPLEKQISSISVLLNIKEYSIVNIDLTLATNEKEYSIRSSNGQIFVTSVYPLSKEEALNKKICDIELQYSGYITVNHGEIKE